MKKSDFHFDLPPELIATHPASERDGSRLMHVSCAGEGVVHHRFSELPGLLREGDLLVLNDSRVRAARLFVNRPGGGESELLLLRPVEPGVWEAIARPARKLKEGTVLTLPGDAGTAEVVGTTDARTRLIRFDSPTQLDELLLKHGEMPLPPYILQQRKNQGEAAHDIAEDKERYQTVYANETGSIAAPTAGLHFTDTLLAELAAKGVEIRRVTLHVGLGTFEPIEMEDFTKHRMHTETYEVAAEDAEAIEAARVDPDRRVVAVGTTSVHALESVMQRRGKIEASAGVTDIFIYPGYTFGAVDAMITNFHLPESSLLMLVSAFASRETMLAAYNEAVRERYRFFSYGDAMLIE